MRYLTIYILILVTFSLKCQDKIFFLDGTTKSGKITEIAPEEITLKVEFENFYYPRNTILLLEFANGSLDIINLPKENVTSVSDKKENFHFKQSKKELYNYNQVSVNTLALCNADAAVFYERILPVKKIGLGVMAAYNFNLYATLLNGNFAILSNAKKNYDLGGFINFYPGRLEKRTRLHFGLMIKYTSFNFSSVKNDSTKVGNLYFSTTKYTPSKGGQLATLFTIGSHTDISKIFFIKTVFGLGRFRLTGDYKTQYNLEFNNINQSTGNSNSKQSDYNFLPKIYFGINLGFKL